MIFQNRINLYIVLIILIMLFSMPSALPANTNNDSAYNKWYEMNRKVVNAYYLGNYNEGIEWAKKALEYAEKHFGPENPSTLDSINNLGGLYIKLGKYNKAEPLFKKTLDLSKKVLGEKHPDTLTSINNLAFVHRKKGQYKKAEHLYQKALTLHETVLGSEHPNTLQVIDNLAGCYESQGRFGEAEPLDKKALELRKKVLGPKHPDTLQSLNNLALLYLYQQRFDEAEPLFTEALQISKIIYGPKHPDTLACINNLAYLYSSQNRYNKAESLFKKAVDLRTEVLSPDHPDTLSSMKNLAFVYSRQNHYNDAEALYQKILQTREDILGPTHPSTLIVYNDLARLYGKQNQFIKAESFYKKALQSHEEVFGLNHPDSLNMRLNYAICLINLDKEKQALSLLKSMEQNFLFRIRQMMTTTLKQRVRRQFLLSVSNFQDVVFTLAQKYQTPDSTFFAANVLLRWKQIQLEEEAFMANLAQTSKDSNITHLSKKIMELRSRLTRLEHHYRQVGTDPVLKEKSGKNLLSVIEELEAAELELTDISQSYKDHLQVYRADMKSVRSHLPENSALIEFRMYHPVDLKTGKLDKHRWAVALVLPESEKTSIAFEDIGPVEDTFQLWNLLHKDINNNHYAANLYQTLFKKLEKQIQNIEKLYIAPDGILNLVSFDSLVLPDGRYWTQRQDLRRIQTGRDFLRSQGKENSGSLLAIGGVDFNRYPGQKKKMARELKGFSSLSHSSHEARKIAKIFKIARKQDPEILTGTEANESALKKLDTVPEILHLSTHGFYLDKEPDKTERPLLLSGLALAGANQGLKGEKSPDNEDGILYSMEILGINFNGTQLISLSACDTGEGVLDYSEGVYGLARAFRIAGARSILMTLWPLMDIESKDFMTSFYHNWLLENSDPAEALRKTRLTYIHHENPKLRDPKVWAPYVLAGN